MHTPHQTTAQHKPSSHDEEGHEADPGRFSLDDLAARLTARGIPAHVEMTGGWVATVYIGHRHHDDTYDLIAGPGSYAPGSSTAHVDEFAVGPDDDATTQPWTTTPADTIDTITEHITARYAIMKTR